MRASKMAWCMEVPTKSDDLTPTLGRHKAEESWIPQGPLTPTKVPDRPLPHTDKYQCDHC